MIRMKITGWIFLLFTIFTVFAGYADALNNETGLAWSFAMDAKISELNKALKEQQSAKEKLLRKSDLLAEKIAQEKRKSQGVSSRKLDSMLRESQQLVSDLETITIQIEGTEGELKQEYSRAITALVNLLEKEPNEKNKKSYVKYLIEYIKAYEGLMKPLLLQVPKINLEIRENDSPAEIRKKADFLSDQTTLLKAKMIQIDAQVAKLEKEKTLRDKVKRFADEIDFFDNTLFVQEKKVILRESGTQDGDHDNEDIIVPPDREDIPIPPDREEPPLLTVGIGQGEIPPSIIVHSEALDSSPADLIFSGNIDNQIEQLKRQKLQMEGQVQQLWQKTQIFYKRADDLSSPVP